MQPNYVCTTCGHHGPAEIHTPGNSAITLVLLLFFLLPGIIYIIWRHTSAKPACSACGSLAVIPPSSPIARQLLADASRHPEPAAHPPAAAPTRPPRAAAVSIGRAIGRAISKLTKRR